MVNNVSVSPREVEWILPPAEIDEVVVVEASDSITNVGAVAVLPMYVRVYGFPDMVLTQTPNGTEVGVFVTVGDSTSLLPVSLVIDLVVDIVGDIEDEIVGDIVLEILGDIVVGVVLLELVFEDLEVLDVLLPSV